VSTASVKKETVGTVVVLRFKGKMTIGVGDVLLREAVREELAKGSRNIVLDLSELSTIDSTGVGELVSAFTSVTSQGGKFKLVGGPQKLEDVLQITQLITVFDVYSDAREAVEAFREEAHQAS